MYVHFNTVKCIQHVKNPVAEINISILCICFISNIASNASLLGCIYYPQYSIPYHIIK